MNAGKITPADYNVTIPYMVVKDKLIVVVSFNGKPYRFIFDTGAPFSISQRLYKDLQLSSSGNVESEGQSGAKNSVITTSVPSIEVGGVAFLETPAVILPNEVSSFLDCLGVDGLIGSNMLRNSTVQFDSRNNQIILTSDAGKLALEKEYASELFLKDNQSSPFIKVKLKKGKQVATDNLLFDSGSDEFYEMSMNAYSFFEAQHVNVSEMLYRSTGSNTAGFNGNAASQLNYIIKVPELHFGNTTFTDVISQTTNNYISRIGSQLLRYGKVTVDYKNKLFYFEPYDRKSKINRNEKIWPISATFAGGKMLVGIIWDKTLEDTINIGDEIYSFANLEYAKMSFCEQFLSDKNKVGDTAELVLKDVKTGALKKVHLERR